MNNGENRRTEPVLALGLMSGTSMDGIDACLLETDGEYIVRAGENLFKPYDEGVRDRLRAAISGKFSEDEKAALARNLTLAHANLVDDLRIKAGLARGEITVVGFHGHTIEHQPALGRPGQGRSIQLGDGALLAAQTGVDVICDFRSRDVVAGGEGAPLVPIYHGALADGLAKPVCVLNIGGVANVTWIGLDRSLVAFDTGPGNALIDDFVRRQTGKNYDDNGRLAAAGEVDEVLVAATLAGPYFARPAPKSLDRNDFSDLLAAVDHLSPADGAATLTAVTARAVAKAAELLPLPPEIWIVTGGGRRNETIMTQLADQLAAPVKPTEALGWDGDMLEAQAFAYLAVRSLRNLAITFPGTTGVPRPLTGATFHPAG